MRTGLPTWAALCLMLAALRGPAAAQTRVTASVATCTTAVVFGPAEWQTRTLVFRATVWVGCPLGVAFSAALRSPSGCEMRSGSGATLRYELFADAALRSAVVSCERATAALSGVGRQSFVLYGRVDGPVAAIGQFHDALVAELAP